MSNRFTDANRQREQQPRAGIRNPNKGPPNSTPIDRTKQAGTTWSSAPVEVPPRPFITVHHRQVDEPRAPLYAPEDIPLSNPHIPERHVRVKEPEAAWYTADRPVRPPVAPHPTTIRQPEVMGTSAPVLTHSALPQAPTTAPTPRAPITPPHEYRYGHAPAPIVQIGPEPPSPSAYLGQPHLAVRIPPDPVRHPILPPQGTARHRQPADSDPRVPVHAAAQSPRTAGHRLSPWLWPEPRDYQIIRHEVNEDASASTAAQPPDPSWSPGGPRASNNRTRSGRARRESHSARPPSPVLRSPPTTRSPTQRRERRPSTSFTANDPFKVQTPQNRRKREEVEVPLNFDAISIPGEETPSDSSSTAEDTIQEPEIPGEEKIGRGSGSGSEHESGHSGSKTSSQLSYTPIAQITNYVIPVVPFIFSTLAGQVYVLVMLRLPLLYFSRVSRIFEEADLSVGDLKQMALETGSKDRRKISSAYELETAEHTPQYERLKETWGDFIDSVMREWKTFNVISVLLLSAILTILQIQAAAVDPVTRYAALSSLLCALISLLYGCTYIIRFGTMRKTYKAFEWALEAKRNQRLWWNVWVMLAMPAIWLTWSIILYIACIMSFIWRTSPQDDGSSPVPLSPRALLIIRVILSSLLGIGVLYGMLILTTFRRYGLVMDRTWQRRIDEWINRMD